MNKKDIINDLAIMASKADPENCVLMVSSCLMSLIITYETMVYVRVNNEFKNVEQKFCNIPMRVDFTLSGYSAYVMKIEDKGEWVLDE